MDMVEQLEDINYRPEPFACYTAADLWTDDHSSEQMLAFHLDAYVDLHLVEVNSLTDQWHGSAHTSKSARVPGRPACPDPESHGVVA